MEIKTIHNGKNYSKISQITVNNKKLITPTYFPSISSLETRANLDKLIRAIVSEQYPRLLVSCYDLEKFEINTKKDIVDRLNGYSKNNGFLMLDSGEFERYYLKSVWSFEEYQNIIQKIESDFYFSFDKISDLEIDYDEILDWTKQYLPLSKSLSQKSNCIGVLHGIREDTVKLTEYILTHYEDLNFIAIADRECGQTLQDQCSTISAIRTICEQHGKKVIIHVLGCGNPLSMAALSYAGADMFDAVDWSRWLIDNRTWQCSNLSHIKLLDCTCIACSDKTLGENEKNRAIQHNLIFYQDFMSRLQNAISHNLELASFLKNENIDQSVIDNLSKIF